MFVRSTDSFTTFWHHSTQSLIRILCLDSFRWTICLYKFVSNLRPQPCLNFQSMFVTIDHSSNHPSIQFLMSFPLDLRTEACLGFIPILNNWLQGWTQHWEFWPMQTRRSAKSVFQNCQNQVKVNITFPLPGTGMQKEILDLKIYFRDGKWWYDDSWL